jgi:hypothetical protein
MLKSCDDSERVSFYCEKFLSCKKIANEASQKSNKGFSKIWITGGD